MPAPLNDTARASLEAELEADFGLTFAQVQDLEQLEEAQRAPIVDGWRQVGKLSWTASPSKWDRFLAILGALAAAANPIASVAGGVTGLAGAIAAIKGI